MLTALLSLSESLLLIKQDIQLGLVLVEELRVEVDLNLDLFNLPLRVLELPAQILSFLLNQLELVALGFYELVHSHQAFLLFPDLSLGILLGPLG